MLNEVTKLVVSLTKLSDEALVYLERQNGKMIQPTLPLGESAPEVKQDIKAEKVVEAEKPAKVKKEKAKPEAARLSEAVDLLADVQKKPETVVYEKITERAISPEESLPLALTTTKEFVQRFQKATPDGLARARKILAEVFKVGKIGDMKHEARVEFIGLLEKEMAGAAK